MAVWALFGGCYPVQHTLKNLPSVAFEGGAVKMPLSKCGEVGKGGGGCCDAPSGLFRDIRDIMAMSKTAQSGRNRS